VGRYRELGVDVRKRGIESFKKLIEGELPHAFCPVTKVGNKALVLHTDGVGSKPVQAYLQWRETSEDKWFDLSQDLLAMNLDDAVCVGCGQFLFVDYVALNPNLVPKRRLLARLARGFERMKEWLNKLGTPFVLLGGETADLPDQLKTFDLSGTVLGIGNPRTIVGGEVKEGDVIIGLRSGGRCKHEKRENSGIMCNGITLARHCLLKPEYAKKYPEIADGKYWGRFDTDQYVEELTMTIGEAILSPTRIYAPLILRLLQKFRQDISGLVHNTGGGLTKCLRIGKNITFVKDKLPDPDPVFILIQREGKVSWREMHQVFNMGVGFEIYARRETAEDIISECQKFGIEASIIGRCERGSGKNRVVLKTKFGKFQYQQ
jgi:phosphoribosylformylglycinamidine cyclo-ligase